VLNDGEIITLKDHCNPL